MHHLFLSPAVVKSEGAQPNKQASDTHTNTTHSGQPPLHVVVRDYTVAAYKSFVALVKSSIHSNGTMLRAHHGKAESLQPKSSEVTAGTLVSSGGHRMTTHRGLVQKHFEETGFGARQSLLTWEVIASITLYAFIGANTASFVARAFQWPWVTSMLLNIFIWPVLSLGALLVLVFFRSLAKKQARKYLQTSRNNAKTLKDQTSALLAVDEAWCAYHVAHAAHDMCVAKMNDKSLRGKELVTPESLRQECHISEKRALRWYKWLAGSASELTARAVSVKTAELHCADPAKICATLFAIYHEDDHDTLSITDALNVLQGWAAGKYGASYIKSADMDYLINTLLAVLLSKCKCGSVTRADWMRLADDYPEFFDVEPQYPQHVRYIRLMDRLPGRCHMSANTTNNNMMDRFAKELAHHSKKQGAQQK